MTQEIPGTIQKEPARLEYNRMVFAKTDKGTFVRGPVVSVKLLCPWACRLSILAVVKRIKMAVLSQTSDQDRVSEQLNFECPDLGDLTVPLQLLRPGCAAPAREPWRLQW